MSYEIKLASERKRNLKVAIASRNHLNGLKSCIRLALGLADKDKIIGISSRTNSFEDLSGQIDIPTIDITQESTIEPTIRDYYLGCMQASKKAELLIIDSLSQNWSDWTSVHMGKAPMLMAKEKSILNSFISKIKNIPVHIIFLYDMADFSSVKTTNDPRITPDKMKVISSKTEMATLPYVISQNADGNYSDFKGSLLKGERSQVTKELAQKIKEEHLK